MPKPENCVIVIFGGSGDLAKRKLVSSLFNLFQNRQLPERFAILGIGLAAYTDESFRDKMVESIDSYRKRETVTSSALPGHYYSKVVRDAVCYAIRYEIISIFDSTIKFLVTFTCSGKFCFWGLIPLCLL